MKVLPDNYLIAKSRLETNFKRLQTDPQLLQSYDDVIKEYLSYGIVERVTDSNTNLCIIYHTEQLFVKNVKQQKCL